MSAADRSPDDVAPSASIELELKFDVDDATPLPDWSAVPGVAVVGAAELRELDALYLDSDDLVLAHAGYAVRRRTGGPDAGWHIKGPRRADGGRVELQWPLGDDDTIPDAVTDALAAVTTITGLAPIARIRNRRTAYALQDERGGVVAEFVDDRVVARDERAGTERTWREWEFELGPAAPAATEERAALFAAARAAVEAAGGRPAASDSKLARTLGH
ncbi:CYTH domain-containing protein [Microbacterium sp. M3]|uniref:CYTH domain-containing protein n=1 Tax=Microbacterium arthrosphaerae TaxID=792652 RepID=A0ABU4GYU4_9MICO|nr:MULTISPECIES: CYTH domain-containing protein [Microbacterium]MDW4572251.1 CYTH domain-containing protein [Microbacterium arthrosphaerae]MDW7606106.1 CYTH domain-containing protein [Microbacterium sp. M3]